MRFFVSLDGMTAEWRHPLDSRPGDRIDWHDCTNMNDDEFAKFVIELQNQNQPQGE